MSQPARVPVRPAPMPAKPAKPFGQQAAMASWVAPIAVVFMNQIINNTERAGTSMTSSIIGFASFGLYALGLVLGLYALTTVPRLGRKGVLIPAVIGVLINGVLLAIFASNFLHALSGR